jgi:hypothetical protein
MKNDSLNIYKNKLNKLIDKLETLEVWKEKDNLIKYVFEQAKWFQTYQLDKQDTDKLLGIGGRLVGAYAFLEAKSSEKMVISKLAELSCKEVKDSLMISLKDDDTTITEARAKAQSQMQEAELDVLLKELEYKRYHAATQGAVNMVIMCQVVLKSKNYESAQTNFQKENQ